VTGKVIIHNIIGEVTTIIGATASNIDVWSNPTVGADVALCGTVAMASAAVGTMFSMTGTLATAMVKTVSGAFVSQAAPTVVAAGTIDIKTSANNTGEMKWLVQWTPLDPGATVSAI
jgi:hypothetical protein